MISDKKEVRTHLYKMTHWVEEKLHMEDEKEHKLFVKLEQNRMG